MFTDENMTAKEELFAWLRHMNKNKGSDLFVTTHFPPAMKLDGKITRITDEPLTAEKCMEIAFSIMSAKQAEEFSSTNECNFAISLPDTSRFRVNAMIQRGATALVFRAITSKIPKFESLNLPPALKDVALKKRGLVIFVGGTGSGKSTSLDRIINFFPEERREQLLTDLSLNLQAFISQRLVPRDGGKGRVAAVEVLLNSPLISELIHNGNIHEIKEVMKKSTTLGMQTFDQHLYQLYEKGEISLQDALKNADSAHDLRLAVQLRSRRAQSSDPDLELL
ncbi:Flp pilus assembly complex ATPase component TadA [Neisseria gonorrhoeae]